ncbi:MobF family relaxase [Chitinophaga pinensis]|uniref:Conjugative relaxase domain protein n=1 Tax=Chitinophaga pinensis (strain ATCC 43595 / DSM 2588 / LMG 13176 / NBRC 15968 / NCIMB 11800 / UQM 2034) TaxID=485918 RepID=A0A979GVY8_CHIPD|nr:MobF family relaxase [Chitinophaga pinensis]ACU63738.1 conjugative relaxase domain protein [Chitinophaga pinensis DSM 2588]
MLRMTQSRSAEQAKDYHNDALLKSDYYLNDQELRGSFNGRLAKRIGINGPTDKFIFDALCENINPITLKPLTSRKSKVRTVGYDLTFCCPKSVSLLHAFAKNDSILTVFRNAVHRTMRDIEKDVQTRVRKKGKDENRITSELLYADFVHQTSRAVNREMPDPFLHCHCYTFNATYDPIEKQFKAVQFRDTMRDLPYYEALFHKRLADGLMKLGYKIRPTKSSFEVVGVDPKLIRLFSKRTNEIEQIAKEKNITDAKELDKIGARSRAKKQKGLSMDDLRTDWERQIKTLNLPSVNTSIVSVQESTSNALTADECIDHSLLHHFERNSVVQDRKILAKAYKFGIDEKNVSITQINTAFKKHPNIINVKQDNRVLCTLDSVLREETRMVKLAHDGKDTFAPLYISAPTLSLKGEQGRAARHVLTTKDKVSIIMGGAGTGKTILMQETVSMIEKTGKKVIVVAPTAKASRDVLKKEGFADAQTVAKLLASPELQKYLQDQILWVDESGLLGTKDMTALLELATTFNTRVILSGDVRQHAAVAYGDSLRILMDAGIVPVTVNKIHRQRKQPYRDAVYDLSKGHVMAAFGKMERMGAIKTCDENYASLTNDYMTAIGQGKTVLVVSPTHAQGETVTKAIRQTLRHAGKLHGKEKPFTRLVNLNLTEAEKADSRYFDSGQILQFNQNCKGITHGTTLSIMQVEGKCLVMKDEKGKNVTASLNDLKGFEVYRKEKIDLLKGDVITVTRNGVDKKKQSLNNGQVLEVVSTAKGDIIARHPDTKALYTLPQQFGHLAYAYCVTSHASQGMTVDEVFISQPASTFAAASMQQFYVSASRGRDCLHVYTDNKEALLDRISQSGERMSALELIKSFPSFTPC